MTDDPVLTLAAAIKAKECATEGMDEVAAARMEAELATLDTYLEMAIPTSTEGAAMKLQKSADFVADEFQDEECAELAEVLLRQMAEQVGCKHDRPIDVAFLRFMAAVLRSFDKNSITANLVGSTLQWLDRPKSI